MNTEERHLWDLLVNALLIIASNSNVYSSDLVSVLKKLSDQLEVVTKGEK